MQPKAKLFAQFEQLWQWVHRTGRGGPNSGDYRPDAALGEALSQSGYFHSSERVTRDGLKSQTEDAADALVGVVGLLRGEDFGAWMQLFRNPQRLEVRHRAA